MKKITTKLTGRLSRRRAVVGGISLVVAVGVVAVLWGAVARAAAFSNTGTIRVTIKNTATGSGIAGAYVQIRPARSGANCPVNSGTTVAPQGSITFTGCPAWGGKAKYKLVSASASGFSKEGSSSYRAAKNGFFLNVKGRKGSRRIAKVIIYLSAKGSPKPTTGSGSTPTLPPIESNPTKQAQNMQDAAASVAKTTLESDTVERINRERRKRGLSTLTVDFTLRRAARGFSYEMAAYCFFPHNHVSQWTGTFSDRMAAAGLDLNAHQTRGEIIYSGSNNGPTDNDNTPAEAVKAWLGSPAHHDIMLYPKFTHIGIGWINQDDVPKDDRCKGSDFNSPGRGFVTGDFSN